MTTMQRFKAYFGMVPPADYEDDYLDDAPMRRDEPGGRRGGYEPSYRDDRDYRDERDYRDDRGYSPDFLDDYDRPEFDRGEYGHVPDYSYSGSVRSAPIADRAVPMERLGRSGRLEPLGARGAATRSPGRPVRGALALDTMDRVFEEGSPLAKITTLRPRDYSEARVIGERFRDGNPVIMDLVEMSNEDAKRLVDFAAGLAFALRGAFDKVATKVFLLSPADVDVSAEDRRKIAETGFYNQD